MLEAIDFLDIDFVWLKDGRSPWDIFLEDQYISQKYASCSRKLKQETFKRFQERWLSEDHILYVGIDWSEHERLERIQKKYKQKVVSPLCDDLFSERWIDRKEIFAFLEKIGLAPPRLYKLGFSHSNCGGFCVKAGLKQFRKLYQFFPDRYLEHEKQEQKFLKAIFPRSYTILRKMLKGKNYKVTMKEFREANFSSKGSAYDFSSSSEFTCGCFSDD